MSYVHSTPGTESRTPGARSGRTRRKTAKAVDYAKEQNFSDSEPDESPPQPLGLPAPPSATRKPRGPGRGRKSAGVEDGNISFEAYGSYSYPGQRFVEKGYDPSLPPIREKYAFAPEKEADGSPKVEAIIGRRPKANKEENVGDGSSDEHDEDELDDCDDDSDDNSKAQDGASTPRKKTRGKSNKTKRVKRPKKKTGKAKTATVKQTPEDKHIEYEYLCKFKGKSYLHLEWKIASDLESMNKSAKALYRRFLKKLELGQDESLEDPSVDPTFTEPGLILDEKEDDVYVELSDQELVDWMKAREKEMAEEDANEQAAQESAKSTTTTEDNVSNTNTIKEEHQRNLQEGKKTSGKPMRTKICFQDSSADVEKSSKVVMKENGPYYPPFEGSDNLYRHGYVTEPPKKPRALYPFFQYALSNLPPAVSNIIASATDIITLVSITWH
eukprot:CAMPEP_0194354420 /NCGR_PEP_ID=MMETSP0174-20130528/2591_1 /TAXON_ID=216777 /ORGANISM="Proboscia alata, Strain PI-D3" /LENGTH=441 /DNA_ID=CAMNT_0039123371 /DNA_START=182 /DNA_END=1507 /DNA_ORIENTATION=-